MSIRHLDALFDPASVVVVGASNRPGSLGAALWGALAAGGFAGRRQAVNRRSPVLADGTRAFARVADLPEAPELALLATPPGRAPALIGELGARGCRAAIVFGGDHDAALRQALLDAARPWLLRVVGPGSLGLQVPAAGLDASLLGRGDGAPAVAGELALIAPSGVLAVPLLGALRGRGIGCSRVLTLGDEADVDAADVLDWLAVDAQTRRIALCLAAPRDARKFMSAARAAARNKPVVVWPVGDAAAPALGEDDADPLCHVDADGVLAAAIRRAGLLRVDSAQALCLAAGTLPRQRDGELPHADGPAPPTAEEAARATALQQAWRRHQEELLQTPPARALPQAADAEPVRRRIAACRAAGRGRLAGAEARALLAEAGIVLAEPPGEGGAGDIRWQAGCARSPVFGPVLWFAADAEGAPRRWALPPLDGPLLRAWLGRVRGPSGGPPPDALVQAVEPLLLVLAQRLADVPALAALRLRGLGHQGDIVAGEAELLLDDGARGGAAAFAITPYPLHWVESVAWSGATLTLRPIRPEDEAQHRAFLAALSPEDIRLRVFYSRRSIEHSELARLTQIDHARELAFLATEPLPDGSERTLGVVRAAIDPEGAAAEFGIVVLSSLKGRGLGRLLMDKLVRALRERGVRRLEATVLAENAGMRGLAARLGFSDAPAPGEPGTRAIALALG